MLKATSTNNYFVIAADQKFLDGADWSSDRARCFAEAWYNPNHSIEYLQKQSQQGDSQHIQRLDNAECLSAYRAGMTTKWANLLLIANTSMYQTPDPLLLVSYVYGTSGFSWMCDSTTLATGSHCNVPPKIEDAKEWQILGTTATDSCELYGDLELAVEYCLAQPAPEICSVGIAVNILVVVLVCNVVKVLCLLCTWRMMSLDPLVTIGDAVASFLDQRDGTTEGYGPIEAYSRAWKENSPNNSPTPTRWEGRSRIGFHAASATRWTISSLLYVHTRFLYGNYADRH